MKKTICVLMLLMATMGLYAQSRAKIVKFHNYPNPFTMASEATIFTLKLDDNSKFKTATLVIYNAEGKEIFREEKIESGGVNDAGEHILTWWRGVDNSGNLVPKALYYAKVAVKTRDGDILNAITKILVK